MAILFYGPDICGFSHLWMRRDFDMLAPHIDTILEHARPESSFFDNCRVVVLPNKKSSGNKFKRFSLDIKQDIQRRKVIRKEVGRREIDKVIVHFLTNAVPHRKVWEESGKPVFVFCHGIDVTWEETGANRKWRKLWWGDYVKEVKKLSNNVTFVANSQVTKKRLTDIGIDSERIAINYLGVPFSDKNPVLKAEKTPVKILFIGRLADVKGPDLTILAFERACKKGLQGELFVAGDGVYREKCENLSRNSDFSDRIHVLGAITSEEGEQLRMDADIFTAHSRKGPESHQEEAYGVAFIEAMVAGLPVVTGKSGALPEIMTHEEHGYLFDPGNVDEHADYLYELYNNPAKRVILGKNACKHARNNFSLEKEKVRLYSLLNLIEEI